jgi:O-antigen/teichoic acid export membrane protein
LVVRRSGSRFYFAALGVAQVCAVVRYAVLARILGPEQLGMAALIVLTGQFFDSLTDTGNDRFLIQDPAGDSKAAFKLVELVAILRGVAMAALIILLAGPVAQLARAPQITDALRIFAVVPFITGFTNYDYRAAQRDHDFRPEGLVLVASEIAGLVATVTAALLVRDFTAILYGLTTRAAVAMAVSQIIARQGYSFGYDSALARRLWRFGAPLMVNGLLLFLANQSDRLIVSRMLGLHELGRYSVVLLLVLYPTSMMMRFVASLFLPMIAGARNEPATQSKIVDQLGSILLLLAVLICVGFGLLAPLVIPVIFGPVYAQSWLLATLVGATMALRLMNQGPTTAALAFGRSDIVMMINFLRLVSIPAALVALALTRNLESVVIGLIVGELTENVGGVLLVNRAARWEPTRGLDRYLAFVIVAGSLILWAATLEAAGMWFTGPLMALVAAVVAAVLWRERSSVAPLWFKVRTLSNS